MEGHLQGQAKRSAGKKECQGPTDLPPKFWWWHSFFMILFWHLLVEYSFGQQKLKRSKKWFDSMLPCHRRCSKEKLTFKSEWNWKTLICRLMVHQIWAYILYSGYFYKNSNHMEGVSLFPLMQNVFRSYEFVRASSVSVCRKLQIVLWHKFISSFAFRFDLNTAKISIPSQCSELY